MKVQCPVPLRSAWSPVGYQVVEVTVAQPPGQAPVVEAKIAGPALPSSPLGYRVVLVAEQKPTEPPPRPLPRATRAARRVPPKTYPATLWVPFAIIGSFVLLFLIGSMAVFSARNFDAPAPRMVWVNQPIQPVLAVEEPQVILPGGLAPAEPVALANVPEAAAPAPEEEGLLGNAGLPADDGCKPGAGRLSDRETFGTAVAFARNPLEAARLARAERKLTFILHVSGNFEEARFT